MTAQALAPIALFVYNRLEHPRQMVRSLLANVLASQSTVYVFSDGPRNAASAEKVASVRKWLRDIDGFKEIIIVERETNFGLAKSIITGVSEVLAKHGDVIVLEDDIVVSPYFLEYMNAGLNTYRDRNDVASIHAYVYPVQTQLPETFFLRGADCWGWATWARAWTAFEPDGKKLLQELFDRKLRREFDYDGAGPFVRMLEDQVAGRNNSWAIRWHAANFLANRFTLYPGRSLVINIGLDGSGEHCGTSDNYQQSLSPTPIEVLPIPISESNLGREAFKSFFIAELKRSRASQLKKFLRDKIAAATKIWN
jgi:hypothetical protein